MLNKLKQIARLAGEEIMKIYQTDFAIIEKEDKSPLTEADRAANAIICEELAKIGRISLSFQRKSKMLLMKNARIGLRCSLLTPLMVPKNSSKRMANLRSILPLVENGIPKKLAWFMLLQLMTCMPLMNQALLNGESLPLKTNESPEKSLIIVASRSHMSEETQAYVDSLKESTESIELTSVGSSLKLCYVASGKADQYPRLAPTMEWDTAAAHAKILAAGKQVLNFETREPLEYNKENLLNPWFLVK